MTYERELFNHQEAVGSVLALLNLEQGTIFSSFLDGETVQKEPFVEVCRKENKRGQIVHTVRFQGKCLFYEKEITSKSGTHTKTQTVFSNDGSVTLSEVHTSRKKNTYVMFVKISADGDQTYKIHDTITTHLH